MFKELIERLIQTNQLRHAYYLEGGDGEELAIWMATRILCCGEGETCLTCARILHHNHPDVIVIRPDGVHIKVDQIREINERAAYKSSDGKGQVFIVSNADVMNLQAANAFLKFLEEPKDGVTIILTGTSKESLIDTVRSRVQVIELPPKQGFMKAAFQRGLELKHLGIYEELDVSVDEVEAIQEVADKWVEVIKDTLSLSRNRALQAVQEWKDLFSDKKQRQFCVKLLQSYVKALFAQKKGTFHNWGELQLYSWEELLMWGKAVDDLSRAFHSNGHFNLHTEIFIKQTIK